MLGYLIGSAVFSLAVGAASALLAHAAGVRKGARRAAAFARRGLRRVEEQLNASEREHLAYLSGNPSWRAGPAVTDRAG